MKFVFFCRLQIYLKELKEPLLPKPTNIYLVLNIIKKAAKAFIFITKI